MKLLTTLYKIYSPSHGEHKMSRFVRRQLDKMGVEYETDNLQIYSLKKGKPLISCHMDQVGWTATTKLTIVQDLIWGDYQIGADDKNGIWVCLKLLKHFGGENLSFIFSTGEEAGCDIDDVLEEHDEAILDNIPYGLVFDRRGNGDIIGTFNDYCMSDLQSDIARLGVAYGYKPCGGVWSDADIISYYDIPCVNLSVGYYNAHTDYEHTNFDELQNALEFGKCILKSLKRKYARTDYFVKHGDEAKGFACGYGVGYEGYFKYTHDYNYKEDSQKEYWPFYCPSCDEYLDEFDITSDYMCKDCYGPIIASEEYEFQHKAYEEDLQELHDESMASNTTIGGTREFYFCPSCCTFEEPTEYEECPNCKASLIKSAMYADW